MSKPFESEVIVGLHVEVQSTVAAELDELVVLKAI